MERRLMRLAIAALVFSATAAVGAGVGNWVTAGTNGFYSYPYARQTTPAYLRDRPVADTFWDEQAGSPILYDQAASFSTATSAQPAYLSASGS